MKNLLFKKTWLVITSLEKYELINKYSYEVTRKKSFELIKYSEDFIDKRKIFNGVVIDENLKPNYEQKILLRKAREDNLEIISISKWIEKYLDIVPHELLDDNIINKFLIKLNKKKSTRIVKRIGDICLGSFLVLITSPIIILAAISIWLQDRGPIFYKQTRSGFKNKTLNIYKMRSMIDNSENNGPQWSTYDDNRITKIGKFLRISRIDELPQLFSVIKGDMSLIGPRPERQEIDLELENKINFYKARYFIKPGISGWAQVNYPYGASINDAKMKSAYDFFYMKNLSIFLDFLILIKTIKVVFTGKGAKPKKNV